AQVVEIAAPKDVVFDVIAQPYLGRPTQAMARKIQMLERGTDLVLAAHRTPGPWPAGRDHGGERQVRPARTRRIPTGARSGPACDRAVPAHRATGRHPARLRR